MPKFEVRNHEWGDNSDYLMATKKSLDEAIQFINDFYKSHPNTSLYERLYIYEIADDGSISIPDYDYEEIIEGSYKSKVSRCRPDVLSQDTDYPHGRELFLEMIEALDNGTAGELRDYYEELVASVVQKNFYARIPKEDMFKALEKSEEFGEKLLVIPSEEYLPGGVSREQCDGWAYKVETPSEMLKNRGRLIQLLQAKCDALEEILLLEKVDRDDEQNYRLKRLSEEVCEIDKYLEIIDKEQYRRLGAFFLNRL